MNAFFLDHTKAESIDNVLLFIFKNQLNQESTFAVIRSSQTTTISHGFYCVHFTCVLLTTHPLKTFRIMENNTNFVWNEIISLCSIFDGVIFSMKGSQAHYWE